MSSKTDIHTMLDFRHFSSSEHTAYRFGFNGQEKDDEVKGNGNHHTTLFRQYDPRTARWFSIDPKANDRASLSPYVSMDDNPILLNDPKGDCPPGVDCGERLKRPAGVNHVIHESRNMSNPFAFNEAGRMSLPTQTEGTYNQALVYTTGTPNIHDITNPHIQTLTEVTKSVSWSYNSDRTQLVLKTTTTNSTSDLMNPKSQIQTNTEVSEYTYDVKDATQLSLFGDFTYKSRDNPSGSTENSTTAPASDRFKRLDNLYKQYNKRVGERLKGGIESAGYEDHLDAVDKQVRFGSENNYD